MLYRFLFSALFVFAACETAEMRETPGDDPINPEPSVTTIMPLGASRVDGARPIYESYRFELWKDLIDGGWSFDYIGTRDDEANYPAYNSQSFDVDHEGRGGWTSGQIRQNLNGWLQQAGSPDIVLFSSPGGNDALQNLPYQDAMENINAIIDLLQANNPEVIIIIEQMAPGRTDFMNAELTSYFNQLREDIAGLATAQSTSSSPILIVDMATGFTDSLLADDVHYNEAGAIFVADRYYAILEEILSQD
ncbi:GDSL-type esterase/lipase family protein [Aureicoccus marinus]|nr:GDSL-type esterase/lipase family protein [Aureicoccus marinus]